MYVFLTFSVNNAILVAYTFTDWLLVWYRMLAIEFTNDCVIKKKGIQKHIYCVIYCCGSLFCSNCWATDLAQTQTAKYTKTSTPTPSPHPRTLKYGHCGCFHSKSAWLWTWPIRMLDWDMKGPIRLIVQTLLSADRQSFCSSACAIDRGWYLARLAFRLLSTYRYFFLDFSLVSSSSSSCIFYFISHLFYFPAQLLCSLLFLSLLNNLILQGK